MSKLKDALVNMNKTAKIIILVCLAILILLGLFACTLHKDKKTERPEAPLSPKEIGIGEDPTYEESDDWWRKYSGGAGAVEAPSIRLTWDPVEGAESYNVYRAEKEDGEYVLVANVTEPVYVDKDTNGRKFYYKTTSIKTVVKKDEEGSTKKVKEEETNKKEVTTAVVTTKPTTTKKGSTTKNTTASTTKHTDITTASTTAPTTAPTQPTTEPTTKPTTKPIPSYPNSGTRTGSSKINNARSVFERNVKNVRSLSSLASYCARAQGVNGTTAQIRVGGTIDGLKSKKISGYSDCYRFTSTSTNNGISYGYVFKVADGTDPADFADKLLSDAVTTYRYGITSYNLRYKAIDYYDDYVFFMVSYN